MKTENTAVQTQPKGSGIATGKELLLTIAMLIKGTYVSWDEIERADAFEMGYENVCQHPNEVGVLGADDELVIDANNILFGDFDIATRVAAEAIKNGAMVGIHTYNPDRLPLVALVALPGIVIAKTHCELRTKMQRLRAGR